MGRIQGKLYMFPSYIFIIEILYDMSCNQKLESTHSKKRKKIEKSPLIPLPIDNQTLSTYWCVHLSRFILFLRTAIY